MRHLTVICVLLVLSGCSGQPPASSAITQSPTPTYDSAVQNVTVVDSGNGAVRVAVAPNATVNGKPAKYVVLADGDTQTIDAVLLAGETAATVEAGRPLTNGTVVGIQTEDGSREMVPVTTED